MQNKVLIILGMHRSGTSLLAQWVMKCGLNIGQNLIGPGIGNLDGHFEDIEFVHMHEFMLRDKKLPINMHSESIMSDLDEKSVAKIKQIVKERNDLFTEWGWKDPRTCLFLNHYRRIIPNAKYLIVVREWNIVVSSFLSKKYKQLVNGKLNNKSFAFKIAWKMLRAKKLKEALYEQNAQTYLEVWINYNDALLSHIKKIGNKDFVITSHKSLLKQTPLIFKILKEKWELNLEYHDFLNVYKENLLSNHTDISPFIRDKALIQKAEQIFSNLESISL